MDHKWAIWKPSINSSLAPEWPVPTIKDLIKLQKQLRSQTKRISGLPYNPTGWRTRAETLIKLGFPELAASDAHKAILLCDAALQRKGQLGDEVWLQFGMVQWSGSWKKGTWKDFTYDMVSFLVVGALFQERLEAYQLLIDALCLLRACFDVKEICEQALLAYPTDPLILAAKSELEQWFVSRNMSTGVVQEISMTGDAGRQLRNPYPWIPERFSIRSDQVILEASRKMGVCSRGMLEVKKSPLGINCFGIFATRNIKAGDFILDSQGCLTVKCNRMSGAACYNCFGRLGNGTVEFPCCPALRFCGPKCQDIAQKSYHGALCGKDFAYLYEKAAKAPYMNFCDDANPPFCSLIWLRMLAVCKTGGSHPLENPNFARLAPQYQSDLAVNWNFRGRVVEPVKILQRLGVDVFADLRFDAWVLENLWHRIDNNYINESEFCAHIDPMYSFFNHTCNPESMFIQASFGSSRCVYRALRDIKKGEEVFTSYVFFKGPGKQNMKAWERAEELLGWLPDGCCCERCVREAMEDEEMG